MAINGIVQYISEFLPDILLFTQAPIIVWFDGTIIDIKQYVREIRNGLWDKESVVFRDFGDNDYRLRPFTVEV